MILSMAVAMTVASTQTASAERPPSNWNQRGWTQGFNGTMPNWTKSTQQFPAVNGGSGRPVWYFTWMVDFATVSGRNCLRIKGNSFGTVDKGGGIQNTNVNGGHNLKYGWFEAATKISATNEWFWPTWWTITPGGGSKDELDIMEYAWGNFGVKHWRHTSGSTAETGSQKLLGRDWNKNSGASYIQANLVDKFSLWSAKSTANGGVTFFKDNSSIASGNRRVDYGMKMFFTSGPNRRRAGTPNNATFPNFYVDYVRVWTP